MVPRSLQIGGHSYKILQQNKLPRALLAELDPNQNLIRLYRRLPPSRKVECLLHEALHAMVAASGRTFVDEEDMVFILGEGLTAFIKANPSFIRHALKTLCG